MIAVIKEKIKDFQMVLTEMKPMTTSMEYKHPPTGVPKVAVTPIPAAIANICLRKVFLEYTLLKIGSRDRLLATQALK